MENALAANSSTYVAINSITCEEHYLQRFEELFKSRARAIDKLSGFLGMEVLKPENPAANEPYLVVSHWTNKESFEGWLASEEFKEGHRRAFMDMKQAAAEGNKPPMHSKFTTYQVLTR